MDPQACFSPPHLTNQGNVLSPFHNAYPHILSYNMQHHESAIFASDAKEESEIFSGVSHNHSATNAIRYSSIMRKNASPLSTGDFYDGKDEAADLSVKSGPPADGFPNPNNTRLLREILQGKKTAEEIMDEDNEEASNAASDFDDESASKNGEEPEDQNAGSSPHLCSDSADTQKVKRARVENIVSNIRVPSNGTCISGASSENSGSISDNRKGKRKQFRPQQLDGSQPPNAEKEIMRKQLDMMQDQIEVMQERYSTLFDEKDGDIEDVGDVRAGEKRKRDDYPNLQDDLVKMHTLSAVQAAVNGVGPSEAGKLASLITAEINEQINPIIKSVINKYFPIKVHHTPIIDHPNAGSRSPSPSRDSQNRSPTRSPVRPTKVTDKHRQPLNASNEVHTRKPFVPPMCLGFPPPPVIGNENKLHFLSMAAMAPTMYGPGFQNLFRSGYFPEQTEAIPLVVSQQKKAKRHKVTDTRVTPRVMSQKIINQKEEQDVRKFMQNSPLNEMYNMNGNLGANGFFLGPRSMRQNVLNHSESSPFYPSQLDQARQMMMSSNFYARNMERDLSSPLNGSVDSPDEQNNETSIDFSDGDSNPGGGRPPTFSSQTDSPYPLSSTLTPMHLRKAKLMFFYTRYPNSATLKTYFPDIKFNKNNTAQLVKWFSNFREFYYNVMEKYAKEALANGVRKAEDIHVEKDSEIFRVLNLHYNRNNHTEVPEPFRDVVEESLRQFFLALQSGRNNEPSWKKAIYKVINRMDDVIPDYFKTSRFMDDLE